MIRASVAILNLGLGLIYTSYGVMTIIDLKRGWKELGFSHFGLAWIAMAFTCGPHHFEHGQHVALWGRNGGPLDVFAVLVGFPAGATWFLLRIEALRGGRGDRFISGTPRWVAALPYVAVAYLVTMVVAISRIVGHDASFTPRMTPNVLLLGLYCLIGYYLLRTQVANHAVTGGWSLSGLALTVVFPTCGLMHTAFVAYAASGRYQVDVHGLVIDWISVPAAIYFVWVVRSLYLGSVHDWNRGAADATPQPALAG
jgi:hypothetical protein